MMNLLVMSAKMFIVCLALLATSSVFCVTETGINQNELPQQHGFILDGYYKVTSDLWAPLRTLSKISRKCCEITCKTLVDCFAYNYMDEHKCELLPKNARMAEKSNVTQIDSCQHYINYDALPSAFLNDESKSVCMKFQRPPYDEQIANQYVCYNNEEVVKNFTQGMKECVVSYKPQVDLYGYDKVDVSVPEPWDHLQQLKNCRKINCQSMVCHKTKRRCWYKYQSHSQTFLLTANIYADYFAPNCV